jgi:large subunit ribosomal protein L52
MLKVSINLLFSVKNTRLISTSCANYLDQNWRKTQRMPENPNVEGPLTNLPDYTFMDGRPTPLGVSFLADKKIFYSKISHFFSADN